MKCKKCITKIFLITPIRAAARLSCDTLHILSDVIYECYEQDQQDDLEYRFYYSYYDPPYHPDEPDDYVFICIFGVNDWIFLSGRIL